MHELKFCPSTHNIRTPKDPQEKELKPVAKERKCNDRRDEPQDQTLISAAINCVTKVHIAGSTFYLVVLVNLTTAAAKYGLASYRPCTLNRTVLFGICRKTFAFGSHSLDFTLHWQLAIGEVHFWLVKPLDLAEHSWFCITHFRFVYQYRQYTLHTVCTVYTIYTLHSVRNIYSILCIVHRGGLQ